MSLSISEDQSASIDSSLLSSRDESTSSSGDPHPLHSSEIPKHEESESKSSKDASTTTNELINGLTKRLMSTSPSPIRNDSFAAQEVHPSYKSYSHDSSSTENIHADWLKVNNELRAHGYNPVILSSKTPVRSINQDCLVLEEDNAVSLRHTMLVMMQDCDRRQGLVQELVSSTRRLQRELDEEKMENFKLQKKVNDYTSTIKDQELKIEGLELIVNQPKLSQDHDSLLAECVRLRGKLRKTKKDNTMMKIELSRDANLKRDYQNLSYANNRSILQIDQPHGIGLSNAITPTKLRNPTQAIDTNNVSNKDDLMHQYNDRLQNLEKDISELKIQLLANSDSGIKLNTKSSSQSMALHASDPMGQQPIHTIKQQQQPQQQPRLVSTTNSHGSKESSPQSDSNTLLGSRPTSSSTDSSSNVESSYLFRKLKSAEKTSRQLRRIAKLLRKENKELTAKLRRRNDKIEQMRSTSKKTSNHHLKKTSNLPLEETDQKCKDSESLQKERTVTEGFVSLNDVSPSKNIHDDLYFLQQTAQWSNKANEILYQMGAILTVVPKSTSSSKAKMAPNLLDECLSVLATWQFELSCGRDVFTLLLNLLESLFPVKKNHFQSLRKSADSVRISDIRSLLTDIMKDHQNGPVIESDCQNVDEERLRQIVLHFMRLFNITDVTNVYTHMTKQHGNLAEVGNVLNSIKDILGLDKTTSSRGVVDAIQKVSSARHLLHIEDFEGAVQKLEKYDEFYHSFKSIMTEIMQTLGCDRMDEVVPSLRAIVRFPQ